MTTVYFEGTVGDDERRAALYAGDIFVFAPRPSTVALRDHARAMIEEAYGAAPTEAQHRVSVEEFVAIGGPLKPRFIHHPRTKELLRDLVADLGCSLDETYLDVPRLRLATSDAYLTAGVGYAFPPHRDTWFSAPYAQINWWLPVYDFTAESGMAFHPRYMTQPIKNGSGRFNYYEWNAHGRKDAAKHIKTDTRDQPKPEEPIEIDPQIRVVCEAGGIILFSAAHLHSTVPNTSGRTRFSIDFRTVHRGDVAEKRGALNVDAACTGTSLRDFMRGTDLERLPEEVVGLYDEAPVDGGVLVFKPDAVGADAR